MTPALLEVDGLTVRFGGLTAVEDLSFRVGEKQITALIGPNGAGKTTAFNAISRLVKPAAGSIRMRGADLLRRHSSQLSGLGLTRTFQNLALWPGLTVLENVMVGAHHRGKQGFGSAALRLGTAREERALRDESFELLRQLDIADVAFQPCEGLPYGTLKRVELARALAGRPKLLMLDEPAAGLTHGEVRALGELIQLIRETTDVSVLLIEHHMRLVMSISDWVVALASGRKLVEGPPSEVQQDERLIEAYLGVRIHMPPSSPLLEATNLSASYGKLQALHEVSFSVDAGETVAILGANGAGKTTTLRAICQLVSTKGTVLFRGKPVPKGKPSACARLGIAMVPEGRGTFMDLSVEDNLRVGGITRSRREVAEGIDWSMGVFPRLAERRTQQARTLSGGEQQMLAIARALMSGPQLLLLDEPSLGLSPLLAAELFRTLKVLASERGITVLLVEQNTSLALELAARAYVLETGRIVATGGPELIQDNEELRRAYLGY